MASSKRTNVILYAGVAAAAAGVIAVAAIVKWKERAIAQATAATRLRDVQEVLTDCYNKVHEIENHLPLQQPLNLSVKGQIRGMRSARSFTNSSGTPAVEM